jgi:integrase
VATCSLGGQVAVACRQHREARIETFFGKVTSLAEVTPSRILELRATLQRQELAPATVNRYLALLRTVLNYAVTAGYLQASPVHRFSRGAYLLPERHEKRSPPIASKQEAASLLAGLHSRQPEWYPMFAFLLFTGARRGEAAGLRWEDVDLSRRVVTIRRSYEAPPKSGRTRTVPIPAELAAVLTEHRMRGGLGGALVFPHPQTGAMLKPTLKAAAILDDACSAAGVPRMRVHDLRHAYASLWLMAGGTIADVQRSLGHSTPILTTEIYGHLAEDHRVREADSRLTLGLAQSGPEPVTDVAAEA